MEIFYILVFGAMAAVVAALELSKNSKDRINTSSAFNTFKNNYLLVYSLMMAGDWLQGPYVYYLYTTYGFSKGDIGQLFIAGFGSSMLFGTIVGSLADKQGRKRACVTYCITYILSCMTKHSPQYRILMVGRILGGIATSLLFSAFESWLVAEHNKKGFEQQWLSLTFSKAIFFGNGLVAILAGLLGNLLVDTLGLGAVAPFDAASCFLIIGMVIIITSWGENFGDSSESKDLLTQFKGAAVAIASDEKIALLGAIQSLFEGSMYTFVFLWTPALSPNDEEIPHGFIFATFMLASMLGSSLASRLLARSAKVESYMQIVFTISSASLTLPIVTSFPVAPADSGRSTLSTSTLLAETAASATGVSTQRNSVVRKLMVQTIGARYEDTTVSTVQHFVAGVENYCASTESLASLGKSLYTSSALVFVMDESMRVILWNERAVKLCGYARKEMAGRNLLKDAPYLVPPSTAKVLADALIHCVRGIPVDSVMLDFISKDQAKVTLLGSCSPLVGNPIGAGMLVVAHDLTHLPFVMVDKKAIVETPAVLDQNKGTPVEALQVAVANPAVCSVQNAVAVPVPLSAAVASNASTIPGWSEIAPNYSIECVLGQGSYGQVVRCKHLPTGEIVAIKKIQNVFSDPIDAKRILRELCIVRQLRHPNIVQIREIIAPVDMDRFQDLFVVFEYLPSDLEKLLHSPQFLTAEHLRWLLLDLLKALKYMHSAEIVHRDLKPANVLLNLSPVAIKICDFGLARGLSSSTSTAGRKRKRLGDGSTPDERTLQGIGVHPRTPARRIQRQLTEHVVTRWYRAPEIIFRDHDYSAAIDVWSIGCIFAELLSMQKSSVPSHYQREPLFPGVSCFPLSPGAGQVALPQDSRDQLNTILDVLGTMAEEDIAEIADPDVQFYLRSLPPRPKRNLQDMYPGAEPEAIDLLTWMLKMNPRKRATLDEALSHKYLASIRSLEEEIVAPGTIQLEFDEKKMNVTEIRQRMVSEIRFYHPTAGTTSSSVARGVQANGVISKKKAKQG